jgi:S1-C subfamily serine protease
VTYTDGTISNPSTSAEIGANSPKYPSLIQHQAPVNHGNSGGPLVDDFGRLIGLNTLTGAGSDEGNQTQGQYYAISVDRIKQALLADLTSGHSVDDLGWTLEPVSSDLLYSFYDQDLADAVIDFLNSQEETSGLMVLGTEPGSVAARNHFVLGDYITAINDTPVTSLADVCEIVQSKQPGSTLRVAGRLLSPDTASDDFGTEFEESMRVPK